MSGVPCAHAMAAILNEGFDPLNYLSSYFSKDTYLQAYENMLMPVKGQMFWPKSPDGPLLPPLVKRMTDRPAKKRKRKPLEGKNKRNLARLGRKMTCTYCHDEGHNKLGCSRRSEFVTSEQATGTKNKGRKQKSSTKQQTNADAMAPIYVSGFTVLNPGCHASLIIRGEVQRPYSSITSNQLFEQRDNILAGNNVRAAMQECNIISTQQSATSRKGKEKARS